MTDEKLNLKFRKGERVPGSFIAFEVTSGGGPHEISVSSFAVIDESNLMDHYRKCVEFYDSGKSYTSRSARVVDNASEYLDPDVLLGSSSSVIALLGIMYKNMELDIASVDSVVGPIERLYSKQERDTLKEVLQDEEFGSSLVATLNGFKLGSMRHHDSTAGVIRYMFNMLEFAFGFDHQKVLIMVSASEYLHGLVASAHSTLLNRDNYLNSPLAVATGPGGRRTPIKDLPQGIVEKAFELALDELEAFSGPEALKIVSDKIAELSGFNGR